MKFTVEETTLNSNLCIGCGICFSVCRYDAIKMKKNDYKEIIPDVNKKFCVGCGECVRYCPHTKDKVLEEGAKISETKNPNNFGLYESEFFLSYDENDLARKRSASGGIATALIKHLFEKNIIDGVIHAEQRQDKVGGIHFIASMSRSYNEASKKRGSFYYPICFSEVISSLKNGKGRYLVIGVPCVIRGLKKLFNENKLYNNNKIYTLALACSHNVNGQFTDFLAESVGITKEQEFKVNLRNKDDIVDANNYNNHFYNDKMNLVKINRFQSKFTEAWRNYFFAMNICHYCSDFWGYEGDITVKDAWGKWAKDPLGQSIVVVRNKELLNEMKQVKGLYSESLSFEEVSNSQLKSSMYKQKYGIDRIKKNIFHSINIKTRYTKYYIISKTSKFLYKTFGYKIASKLLFLLLNIFKGSEKMIVDESRVFLSPLLKDIKNKLIDKKILLFGTGEMAELIAKELNYKIDYYLDNNEKKHGKIFLKREVRTPKAVLNEKSDFIIIIGSMYYIEILLQLKEMGVSEDNIINGVYLYNDIINRRRYKFKKRLNHTLNNIKKSFRYNKSKKYKKILVLGGYGNKIENRNAGDEAQLNDTLQILYREFPDYLVKVLSPNPHDTRIQHYNCIVGEAPRTAFYNFDKPYSPYHLHNCWDKVKFLLTGTLIYLNAFLIRMNLPPVFINARKSSLLYEIKTSDLIYFSGGGYLTGDTLPRLWDGMFFIRIAKVFKVPVVLSGQTIGIWNNGFNRRFAKWGLSKADLITLRDLGISKDDLEEIGLQGEHIFDTFDDALFCKRLNDKSKMGKLLLESGVKELDLEKPYISFNIHSWKVETEKDKMDLFKKIKEIVDQITTKSDFNIVFIPMVKVDKLFMAEYMAFYPNEKLYILEYTYDFEEVREVIASSQICVTMRHHPIIFSMGEGVPTITVYNTEYFEHKNLGALKNFEMQKYGIDLNGEDYIENFNLIFDEIIENREVLRKNILSTLELLEKKKDHFIRETKKLIH